MKISNLLNEENIISDLKSLDKKEAIKELAEPIAKSFNIDIETLIKVLMEREKLGTTGIGEGIGLPHGKMKELESPAVSFGISKKGVNFDSIDGLPTYIFFLLLTPDEATVMHLQLLAQVSGLLRNKQIREALLTVTDKKEILSIIKNGEDDLL
jgi:nitrogen PTS system EIIA component